MAVSKRLRYEILRRDNHTCRYCGGSAPDVVLTVDHVVPTALGGSDDPTNLVAACRDCNAGKTSSGPDAPLVADVEQKAIEWAAAIDAYNASRSAGRRERDHYVLQFEQAWDTWHCGPKKEPVPRDDGWLGTIWRFHDSGLPVEEVLDAVQIACGNARIPTSKAWAYFCGVAWKRIQAMQEGAQALLSEDSAAEESLEYERLVDAAEEHTRKVARGVFDDLAFSDIPYRILLSVVDGPTDSHVLAYDLSCYRWVA